MGATHRSIAHRGRINLDWMLIAVSVMAVGLIAGSVIRTDVASGSQQFGTYIGGLRALGPTEDLVAFEDMSAGHGAAWSGGARYDADVSMGAVWLAVPSDAPLRREVTLPEGTVRAVLSLDLIAIDDWTLQGLEVALNGAVVLRQSFSTHPDLIAQQRTETPAVPRVTLRSRLADPLELAFATGDAALAETRLSVEIAVTTPGDMLTLSITPVPAEATREDAAIPAWAVDNLIVVAERLP